MANSSGSTGSSQEAGASSGETSSSRTASATVTRQRTENCKSYPEMLAAVALVSIGLTEGRSNIEIETLLNFIHLLEQSINYVLAQRIIDSKNESRVDIDIPI